MCRLAMTLLLINHFRWLEVGSRVSRTKDEGCCYIYTTTGILRYILLPS